MEKTYQLSGLKCQGCVDTVTQKLSSLKGVEVLEVSLADKTITLDTKVWKWRLNQALKGTKFKLEKELN
jgi:copper chaperone CopZ